MAGGIIPSSPFRAAQLFHQTKATGNHPVALLFMLSEGIGQAELLSAFLFYLLYCRYRKVTICARVQSASGLKAAAAVPEVMPFSTAQDTASA